MNAQSIDLAALESDLLDRITAAKDDAALEALRVEALGKQGSISALMKNLGTMSPDERKTFGPKLNGLKDKVGEAIAVKKAAFAEAALDAQLKAEAVDVTLPPVKPRLGTIHPVSRVMEELALIFGEMGFSVEEGPDIETEWFNFTALNTPEKHPARDLQDTFYLNGHGEGGRKLLRTQTSPVQIRTMQKQKPPIRMICMGRTFRRDNDATHTPMFHQIEGLVIDKTSTMADLKGVLTAFLKAYFETDAIELRFRPHFFPFTEPSAEMDMRWDRGKGEARWLELGGCGMVHPNVLTNCGIDPNEYQGYAWGFGLDRMAMLKYGMNDLRPLFESDTRWMKHYGFSPFLLPGLANGVGQ